MVAASSPHTVNSSSLIMPLLTTPSKGVNNALSTGMHQVLFTPLEGVVSRGVCDNENSSKWIS